METSEDGVVVLVILPEGFHQNLTHFLEIFPKAARSIF